MRKFLASTTFFYVLIGFIAASCLFFAANITYQIPPDEYYHFRFIEYYAKQPVLDGPVITNQGVEHFDLRDITRIPNYLYHYVMSFVLRLTYLFTDSIFTQVFILRVLSIAIGIASLFIVRRILKQIGANGFTQNSVLLLLSLTGMLLWIFSSINYDVPSIFLYLSCVSVSLSILQGKGITTRRLGWFAVLAMLCVLTKVTFIPFLGLLVVITAFLKRKDFRFVQDLRLTNYKHLVLIVAVLLIGFLFVERIGGNLVRYHQIEVVCDKIHAYSDCMQDDVFSRNEIQLRAYAQQKARGDGVTYQPYQFTQMWVTFMYERSHFYYGHEQMRANYGAKIMAGLTAIAFIILAAVFRKRIAETPGEKLLFWVTLSYALVMYMFNLQTWLKYGQPYAFQGRYLFPVIPFLFYFCVKLLILAYQRLHGRLRQAFAGLVILVAVLSIYTHLPILVFYRGSETKWWPTPLQAFNLRVQNDLSKINIKTLH
jgi:hypothetical protein